jgi:putative N-acetylmannosamine-6-phosphate epimerase
VLAVIDEVEAPVLHNKVPVAIVDNVEVPLQLSTTFTTGVDGVVLGAAVPVPGKLLQPFTVFVTV